MRDSRAMWDHRCNECAGAMIGVENGRPCNYCDDKPTSHAETRATLHASGMMSRAAHPLFMNGAVMADPTSAFAGGLLAKLLPAGLGAALMVAVDPPKTKGELFARAFVAFACSYLFGDTLFDFLDSTTVFAFLDQAKRHHHVAVDGFVGAVGWAAAGGLSMWLRKFRGDPVATVKELKP